jgi:hypothetical protein
MTSVLAMVRLLWVTRINWLSFENLRIILLNLSMLVSSSGASASSKMQRLWWSGLPYYQFVHNPDPEFDFWLPGFKFDMISVGFGEKEELQNWKKRMSDDLYWQVAETSISESIERAIESEDLDDESQRDGDADFVGGGRQPPGGNAGGEDGNGAHPARATLIIEIG